MNFLRETVVADTGHKHFQEKSFFSLPNEMSLKHVSRNLTSIMKHLEKMEIKISVSKRKDYRAYKVDTTNAGGL